MRRETQPPPKLTAERAEELGRILVTAAGGGHYDADDAALALVELVDGIAAERDPNTAGFLADYAVSGAFAETDRAHGEAIERLRAAARSNGLRIGRTADEQRAAREKGGRRR